MCQLDFSASYHHTEGRKDASGEKWFRIQRAACNPPCVCWSTSMRNYSATVNQINDPCISLKESTPIREWATNSGHSRGSNLNAFLVRGGWERPLPSKHIATWPLLPLSRACGLPLFSHEITRKLVFCFYLQSVSIQTSQFGCIKTCVIVYSSNRKAKSYLC